MTAPTLVDVIRDSVRRTPDAVALVDAGEEVTYADLLARAESVATALARDGVTRGDRVAIAGERSTAFVAGLLGVLIAGAAYVPVDHAQPMLRLRTVLTEAEVRLVLCDASARRAVLNTGSRALDLVRATRTPADPAAFCDALTDRDAIYLMFTSGSSGVPKAIVVEHRSVVNLVVDPSFAPVTSEDRVLMHAPLYFDGSTLEIWAPLVNGATVIVAPPGLATAEDFAEVLRAHGVTIMVMTAVLFTRQVESDPESLAGVRFLITGGDVVPARHVQRLAGIAPGCTVVHGYGPAETTTLAMVYHVPHDEDFDRPLHLGAGLGGVQIHLLDGSLEPVGPGEVGELCITGAGVSRGYWRRPGTTADRFLPAPGGPAGARMYRSGDLARLREDRTLEFVGRADAQVKILGKRAEPGEVEAVLARHPKVQKAVVLGRPNHLGEKALVAYVVTAGDETTVDELRRFIKQRLPTYLVPSVIMLLDELPMTHIGKVDRAALPVPDWTHRDSYA